MRWERGLPWGLSLFYGQLLIKVWIIYYLGRRFWGGEGFHAFSPSLGQGLSLLCLRPVWLDHDFRKMVINVCGMLPRWAANFPDDRL